MFVQFIFMVLAATAKAVCATATLAVGYGKKEQNFYIFSGFQPLLEKKSVYRKSSLPETIYRILNSKNTIQC